MPSSSEQQRKFIFAKRSQYGSRDKAPKKRQWVFDKEWEKVEEDNYMEKYKRFFSEMSLPNITYIKLAIKNEIKKADLRLRSDREHKEYNKAYRDYLSNYFDGDIDPSDVAELASNKTNTYDDSPEAGRIEAAKFVINLIKNS